MTETQPPGNAPTVKSSTLAREEREHLKSYQTESKKTEKNTNKTYYSLTEQVNLAKSLEMPTQTLLARWSKKAESLLKKLKTPRKFGKTFNWYDDWSMSLDDRTIIIELPHAHENNKRLFLELDTTKQAQDLQKLLISLFWRVTK